MGLGLSLAGVLLFGALVLYAYGFLPANSVQDWMIVLSIIMLIGAGAFIVNNALENGDRMKVLEEKILQDKKKE